MEQGYYDEMKQNIDTAISEKKFVNRTLVIMGHCEAAEKLLEYLTSRQLPVASVVDNNTGKQGKACMGIWIEAPQSRLLPHDEALLILIISRHFEAMAAQLRKMGYEGQIMKVVDYDSFSEFSTEDKVFAKRAGRIRVGAALIDRIKSRHPGRAAVVCPYNALGDVYLLGTYMAAYCRKLGRDDRNTVWVVTGESCGQIPGLFGYEKTVVLEKNEMDLLVQAAVFLADKDVWILHHDRPYTNVNIKISDLYPVPFLCHYPCCVLGLSGKHLKKYPKKRPGKEYQEIEKGKTVVLSPYAKSMVAMPKGYWEKIARECQKRGMIAVTNVNGREKPVKGTRGISYSLREMIGVVEYAGYFVGIRSGLCDVLESASCQKYIVYPKGKYSTTKMELKTFFYMAGDTYNGT